MKLIVTAFLTLFSLNALAAGGGAVRDVHIDLSDKASLQNGAKLFVNYCQGCHSLEYMRYNRLAQDLEIDEKTLLDNLMFNTDKTGDLISSAISQEEAVTWFGKQPPDLSLYARARGADHLFTYLTGFYREDSGKVNNVALPGLSMPHVMWELQGWQKLLPQAEDDHSYRKFEISEAGQLSPEEFDEEMTDLTRFLVYVSEPAALVRVKTGVYIILYLALLCFILVLLKKEYWRDVH